MPDDFAFDDRVARLYNAQRAHPPEVSRSIGAALRSAAGDGASVLEIGIGTGRIALPTVAAGCRVTGIDISHEMLAELGGELPAGLALTQADMHMLPFADQSFDAVLAVHVLHLSREGRRMLEEIARVLKPGGALIQGDDWIDPQSVVGQLRDRLRQETVALAPHLQPPSLGISRPQVLAELGGTEVTETVAAEWTTYISPADRLYAVENKIDAESWVLPPQLFDTILLRLRDYATNTWSDLEARQPVTRRFLIKVTRGHWHPT